MLLPTAHRVITMFFKIPNKKNPKSDPLRQSSSEARIRNPKWGLPSTTFKTKFSAILNRTKSGAGFTLLEIIVVFSVIAIVATVGVAAFVNYSKTQSLQTSYLDLKSTLATAKSYSLSQIKPAECATFTLIGYEVSLDIFDNKYSLVAKCQGFDKTLKTSSFPANVGFNSSLTTSEAFLFPVLSKTMTGGTITVQQGLRPVCPQDCKIITIDDLGGIR